MSRGVYLPLLVLASLLAVSIPVSANHVSVLVVFSTGTYQQGDEVTGTVHVFHEGAYADAERIDIDIDGIQALPQLEETGHYSFMFTVTEDQANNSAANVFVSIDLDGHGDGFFTTLDLMIAPPSPAEGRVVSGGAAENDGLVTQGQEILFDYSFTENGTALDPTDPPTLDYAGDAGNGAIPLQRLAPGHYTGNWTVPVVDQGSCWDFTLDANYLGNSYTHAIEHEELCLVKFTYIVESIRASLSGVTQRVLVSNTGGSAISGAILFVNYFGFNTSMAGTRNVSTDGSGAATVTIDDIDVNETDIFFDIVVSVNDERDEFDFVLTLVEPDYVPATPRSGFDVVSQNDRPDNARPGGRSTLSWIAYDDGDPLNNTHVWWYAWSNYGVAAGNESTNDAGEFQTGLEIPMLTEDGGWSIQFYTRLGGGVDGRTFYYGYDAEDTLIRSEDIGMEIDKLRIGERTTVEVTVPSVVSSAFNDPARGATGMVGFYVGDVGLDGDQHMFDPATSFSVISEYGFEPLFTVKTREAGDWSITIPDTLSEDLAYTIFTVFFYEDPRGVDRVIYTSTVLEPGEGNKGVFDSLDLPDWLEWLDNDLFGVPGLAPILILPLMLIIGLVVTFFVMRSRRNQDRSAGGDDDDRFGPYSDPEAKPPSEIGDEPLMELDEDLFGGWTRDELEAKTKAQLQDLCRDKGLASGGNKAALVDRLLAD